MDMSVGLSSFGGAQDNLRASSDLKDAPGSRCTLQGTSRGVALRTQLICARFRATGTGDLDLYYDKSRNNNFPAVVELTR
jgi:hypothetical protein